MSTETSMVVVDEYGELHRITVPLPGSQRKKTAREKRLEAERASKVEVGVVDAGGTLHRILVRPEAVARPVLVGV